MVLNKFIATAQRYGNYLIHRCDDRLNPQFEFQQASGCEGGNGRVERQCDQLKLTQHFIPQSLATEAA